MPSLRSPASSPAVGRWLMCISQPASCGSLRIARRAAELVGTETLSAVSVSARSRLTSRFLNTFFLSWETESITSGESISRSSGSFASSLIALRMQLEAACSSGEFLPVTIVPSGSSSAAPQ